MPRPTRNSDRIRAGRRGYDDGHAAIVTDLNAELRRFDSVRITPAVESTWLPRIATGVGAVYDQLVGPSWPRRSTRSFRSWWSSINEMSRRPSGRPRTAVVADAARPAIPVSAG
ncbi:hypothetical protein [Nocardia colli]|uniref:hypothetical protein n=1 Tax=Nocardia colli TaxID=2545717 RepID=UPI0035DE065A